MSNPSTKPSKHGGKRPGAGRPRKTGTKTYDPGEAALKYLADVAAGIEPPNRDRIAAARALLPYQAPRQRAPVKSPTPRELQRKTAAATESDWNAKSAEIRARLGRKE